MLLRFAAIALGLVACGGRYQAPRPTPPGEPAVVESGPIDLERAALPSRLIDARTGHQLDDAMAWQRLAAARAVCVGEEHPNPHHHWAQLAIVRELVARAAARGDALALGMEMFQRPVQGVVDDFVAGTIDEPTLLSRSGWAERWGYDFGFYRQTIAAAIAGKASILALNAERELTKQVARGGLASLPPADRAKVPELVLDDARHLAWWNAIMASMEGHGHGGHGGHGDDLGAGGASELGDATKPAAPDPIYTVQVIWDETMADGAARWLGTDPTRQVIVLAGNGHCHDSAIVGRLRRRGVTTAMSVRPVIDAEDAVASALAEQQNDLLWVMALPTSPAATATP